MLITKIRAAGFLRFVKPMEIDLEALGDGLIAFVGRNGSGKTSALELVPAVLYGDLPSRSRKASLYDRCTGRDATLELEALVPSLDDSLTDRVQLTVKLDATARKAEFLFVRNGKPNNGKAETFGPLVQSIAGSRNLMLASVFAAQNRRGQILSIPRSERRELFAEFLGLADIQDLAERAYHQSLQADQDLVERRAKVVQLTEQLADRPELRDAIELVLGKSSEVSQELEEYAGHALDVRHKADSIEVIEKALRDLGLELDTANAARSRRRRARLAHDEGAEALERLEKSDGALLEQAEAINQAVVDVETLQRVETASLEVINSEKDLQSVSEAAGTALAEADRMVIDADRRLEEKRQRLQEAAQTSAPCTAAATWDGFTDSQEDSDETTGLDLAGTCDFLKRSRTAAEDLRHEGGWAETDQVEKAAAKKDEANEDLVAALDEAKEIEEAAARAADTLPETLELLAAARGLAAKVEVLEAAQARREHHQAERRRLKEALEAELLAIGQEELQDPEAIQAQIDTRKAELPNPEDRRKVQLALGSLDAAKEDLDRRGQTIRDERVRIETQLEGLKAISDQRDELEEGLAGGEQDLADWKLLYEGLGPNGVQALLLDAAGPEVAGLANTLLEICWEGQFSIEFQTLKPKKKGGGFQEVFDILVYDEGKPRDAEDLSGGEQAVLSEAIAIAVAIRNQRHGIRWRQLFRDETAGALDPEAAQAYVAMLRKALEIGGFRQVIFVAHQAEVWQAADAQVYFDRGTVSTIRKGEEWLAAV